MVCLGCLPAHRMLAGHRILDSGHRLLASSHKLWSTHRLLVSSQNLVSGHRPPVSHQNLVSSHRLPVSGHSAVTVSLHTSGPMPGVAGGLVSRLPGPARPFLRLARMDRPIGTWLLFWPCGWSIGLAANSGQVPDLGLLTTFAIGAFVMRGAGCTINDMWDRNIDSKVARTRDRPITSGQVSLFDALVFLGGQLGVGLLILLTLNWYSVLLGASSMGLVIAYPVMKRFTYYPQFVLGLAFNWGALLGWSSVTGLCDWSVCLPLYAAGISWTMIYDTIYAHQDKYDDAILGVKSTAIKFGENTGVCLYCFAITMVGSLGYCGWTTDQSWPYYLSLLYVIGHLGHQIGTLDINNRDDCARKFMSNRRVGLVIFLGIFAGSLVKGGPCGQPGDPVAAREECIG